MLLLRRVFTGSTHVQDEHLAALRNRTCLQKLARLGDSHEIAGDFWMCYGDGTTTHDLFFEARQHRT